MARSVHQPPARGMRVRVSGGGGGGDSVSSLLENFSSRISVYKHSRIYENQAGDTFYNLCNFKKMCVCVCV